MSFDPYDQKSWFFGSLTRNQTIKILEREKDIGVFLVRNSTSIAGDLVLSVRERDKISHYIINRVDMDGETKFKIGENVFQDLPSLLTFYKHHFLDSTPLIKAATTKLLYVRAKFEFLGKDKEDLPFKKNEILTVISKVEDQWWTARNESGTIGSIPVPYVEPIDEEEYLSEKNNSANNGVQCETPKSCHNDNVSNESSSLNRSSIESSTSSTLNTQLSNLDIKSTQNGEQKKSVPNINRKLPARAVVVQQRIPNAYDKKALKLEKGDILTVTSTNINGQWEGELNGKKGHFPFNYIKFLDDDVETVS